jgi:hypothetical protein
MTDQSVTYKLFRFVDMNVERGKTYRYRVRLTLEDPNHPRLTSGGGGSNVGASQDPGPPPSSLDREVEARLKKLAAEEKAKNKRIFYRDTDWSEASPAVTVPNPMMLIANSVDPARRTTMGDAEIAVTEPKGKAMVVQWDDLYAVHVAAEEEVERGKILNFIKEGEALHPLRFEFVKLKDYPFHSDAMVVDFRGGDRLPSKDALTAPGRIAFIDNTGKLIVENEADGLETWLRYAEVEPKKAPDADEGRFPGGVEPGRGGRDRDLLVPRPPTGPRERR